MFYIFIIYVYIYFIIYCVTQSNGIWSAHRISKRIVNGDFAELHQFPWHAKLGIVIDPKSNKALCGGTLINKFWIVTAAHCTENAQLIWIGLGCYNAATFEFMSKSKSIITHKDCTAPTMANDIGLVEMINPVPDTKLIIPLNIIPKYLDNDDFISRHAHLAGLGVMIDKSYKRPAKLLWMWLKTVPVSKCMECYGQNFDQSKLICAEAINKTQNLCDGDSGGGLVANINSTNYLIGVASFGRVEICTGVPVGFTRISNYLDWIEENMKNKN